MNDVFMNDVFMNFFFFGDFLINRREIILIYPNNSGIQLCFRLQAHSTFLAVQTYPRYPGNVLDTIKGQKMQK